MNSLYLFSLCESPSPHHAGQCRVVQDMLITIFVEKGISPVPCFGASHRAIHWSVTRIKAVLKFASYVATLPSERWTRRILEWNIRGPRKRGRPAHTWETSRIASGNVVTTGLWTLLHIIVGCGRNTTLCFSRCTLVDRVKSCISFVCALEGLSSVR